MRTLAEELLQECLSARGIVFGKREDVYEQRLAKAKLLSNLMLLSSDATA